MKNNIDKLTDTEILELAGYTKHIDAIAENYNVYVSRLLGRDSTEASISYHLIKTMNIMKVEIENLISDRAEDMINDNSNVTVPDLLYGNYNKKNELINNFINISRQSHTALGGGKQAYYHRDLISSVGA